MKSAAAHPTIARLVSADSYFQRQNIRELEDEQGRTVLELESSDDDDDDDNVDNNKNDNRKTTPPTSNAGPAAVAERVYDLCMDDSSDDSDKEDEKNASTCTPSQAKAGVTMGSRENPTPGHGPVGPPTVAASATAKRVLDLRPSPIQTSKRQRNSYLDARNRQVSRDDSDDNARRPGASPSSVSNSAKRPPQPPNTNSDKSNQKTHQGIIDLESDDDNDDDGTRKNDHEATQPDSSHAKSSPKSNEKSSRSRNANHRIIVLDDFDDSPDTAGPSDSVMDSDENGNARQQDDLQSASSNASNKAQRNCPFPNGSSRNGSEEVIILDFDDDDNDDAKRPAQSQNSIQPENLPSSSQAEQIPTPKQIPKPKRTSSSNAKKTSEKIIVLDSDIDDDDNNDNGNSNNRPLCTGKGNLEDPCKIASDSESDHESVAVPRPAPSHSPARRPSLTNSVTSVEQTNRPRHLSKQASPGRHQRGYHVDQVTSPRKRKANQLSTNHMTRSPPRHLLRPPATSNAPSMRVVSTQDVVHMPSDNDDDENVSKRDVSTSESASSATNSMAHRSGSGLPEECRLVHDVDDEEDEDHGVDQAVEAVSTHRAASPFQRIDVRASDVQIDVEVDQSSDIVPREEALGLSPRQGDNVNRSSFEEAHNEIGPGCTERTRTGKLVPDSDGESVVEHESSDVETVATVALEVPDWEFTNEFVGDVPYTAISEPCHEGATGDVVVDIVFTDESDQRCNEEVSDNIERTILLIQSGSDIELETPNPIVEPNCDESDEVQTHDESAPTEDFEGGTVHESSVATSSCVAPISTSRPSGEGTAVTTSPVNTARQNDGSDMSEILLRASSDDGNTIRFIRRPESPFQVSRVSPESLETIHKLTSEQMAENDVATTDSLTLHQHCDDANVAESCEVPRSPTESVAVCSKEGPLLADGGAGSETKETPRNDADGIGTSIAKLSSQPGPRKDNGYVSWFEAQLKSIVSPFVGRGRTQTSSQHGLATCDVMRHNGSLTTMAKTPDIDRMGSDSVECDIPASNCNVESDSVECNIRVSNCIATTEGASTDNGEMAASSLSSNVCNNQTFAVSGPNLEKKKVQPSSTHVAFHECIGPFSSSLPSCATTDGSIALGDHWKSPPCTEEAPLNKVVAEEGSREGIMTDPLLKERAVPPPVRDLSMRLSTGLSDHTKGAPFPPVAEEAPANKTTLVAEGGVSEVMVTEPPPVRDVSIADYSNKTKLVAEADFSEAMVTGPLLEEQGMPPAEKDVSIMPSATASDHREGLSCAPAAEMSSATVSDHREGLPCASAAEMSPLNKAKLVAEAGCSEGMVGAPRVDEQLMPPPNRMHPAVSPMQSSGRQDDFMNDSSEACFDCNARGGTSLPQTSLANGQNNITDPLEPLADCVADKPRTPLSSRLDPINVSTGEGARAKRRRRPERRRKESDSKLYYYESDASFPSFSSVSKSAVASPCSQGDLSVEANMPEFDDDLASMNTVEHLCRVELHRETKLPIYYFTVFSVDETLFEFRVDIKQSKIPNSGYGAFLTFLGAKVLKPEARRRADVAMNERDIYIPETLQPLTAVSPDGFGIELKLAGANLHGNGNNIYWPKCLLSQGTSFDERVASDGKVDNLKVHIPGGIGFLGMHTLADYKEDPKLKFCSRRKGFGLIDLGRYGPFRKEDRKQKVDFDLKSFIFCHVPSEWCFGVDERLHGHEQIVDITGDDTGEPHQLARDAIPMYVNEVGHNRSLKQNVFAKEKDERTVNYYLNLSETLAKGESVELLVDYFEVYELVRERKGYGKGNLVGELKGDEHLASFLLRNFTEREAIEDMVCSLSVKESFYALDFVATRICLPIVAVTNAYLDGTDPQKPTNLQWMARRRLHWLSGIFKKQLKKLERSFNMEKTYMHVGELTYPYAAMIEKSRSQLAGMKWSHASMKKFFREFQKADPKDECAPLSFSLEIYEEILFNVRKRLIEPLNESVWCPIAQKLIAKLAKVVASVLWTENHVVANACVRSVLISTGKLFISDVVAACDSSEHKLLEFSPSAIGWLRSLTLQSVNESIARKIAGPYVIACAADGLEWVPTQRTPGAFEPSINKEWYLLWQVLYVVDTFASKYYSGSADELMEGLCTHAGVSLSALQAARQKGVSEIYGPPRPKRRSSANAASNSGKTQDKVQNQKPRRASDGVAKPRVNNFLWFKIVWACLSKLGWTLDTGTRPTDYYFLPPGVRRERGFRNRTDYFDSIVLVLDFVRNDSRWRDNEEVKESLDCLTKCTALVDDLRKRRKLPKGELKVEWLLKQLEEQGGST